MKVPDAVGVPLIVIVLLAHVAVTPGGNPFAPETPALVIPVAIVVVCVMVVKAVLIHNVGVDVAALAVLTCMVTVVFPDTLPHALVTVTE